MDDLIKRLEEAKEGSMASWCDKCGRVNLTFPRGGRGSKRIERLRASMMDDCDGIIDFGTPQECLAALRARAQEG